MDHIGLYVTEKGVRTPYKRILHDKGIPNYIPIKPDDLHKDLQIDQVLFLPIEKEIFDTDREYAHVGFRYVYSSVGHSTVSILEDPSLLGITTLQLSAFVQRFRYTIKDDIDIIIDKVCDPLYPPRIFELECASRNISEEILNLVTDITNRLNSWYLDKNV